MVCSEVLGSVILFFPNKYSFLRHLVNEYTILKHLVTEFTILKQLVTEYTMFWGRQSKI